MQNLETFLIKAKKQTYANANIKKALSTRNQSKDYEYQDGNYLYHDTYFGTTNFIGEEVVYLDNQIYWAMNYYGKTLDDDYSEEAMDKALRPALMHVGESKNVLSVRGPKEYLNGEYKYTFQTKGDITNFEGVETIYKNNKKIYELKCHGGLIK